MIASGISPLDERLGGLVPQRTYVFDGAPGTGKSVACLEFLAAGLSQGERVVMITHDDPSDLLSQARFLGIDLEAALAGEQAILLRYQLDFVRRYGRVASVDVVFEELRKLIGPDAPTRLVVDSVAPFLEGGPASGAGLTALLKFLDSLGATSFLTYPGDLASSYDRRVESLVQHAAGIFHLAADSSRTGSLEIRKVRFEAPSTASIRFRIVAGSGIVALADGRQRRAGDVDEATKRKVLVLDLTQGFPREFLHAMRDSYDVSIQNGLARAYGDLVGRVGAVLIDVRRDSIGDVLALVREMRRTGSRSPIILVTAFQLRSDDRARALRAGADDFIAAARHPDEYLFRLEAAMRRGHRAELEEPELPVVLQSNGNGSRKPLDDMEFRRAVGEHLRHERAPFFTVLTMRTAAGAVDGLTKLALQNIRAEGGDLVGVDGQRVSVFLQAARRKDVEPFAHRLQQQARSSNLGEIEIETATCPGDEHRLREYVEAAAGQQGHNAV